MSQVEQILEFNKAFVENKEYEPYQTTVYPDRSMAILTCMDSRLIELLPKALGIKNGEVKLIKTAGGFTTDPYGGEMRSLLVTAHLFKIGDILIIGHEDCGMEGLEPDALIEKMVANGIEPTEIDKLETDGVDVKGRLCGFEDVDDAVRATVKLVEEHPLMPKDVRVHGFVISPVTGALRTLASTRVV
ncbi:MAG: carbonic anhydrase [Coriobacteriia bacterium]|nr:carbonic anhydrase [Coriobacteriia bacterium]